MRVPQTVDKWIVFAVMLATAVTDLSLSTLPGAGVIDWVMVPLLFALLGTAVYLVWCALCRLVCRLVRAEARARLIANGVAAVAFALAACWPILFPGHVIKET